MPRKQSASAEFDLLGRVYDAALDPKAWPAFLHDCAQHLKAASAHLVFHYSRERRVGYFASSGVLADPADADGALAAFTDDPLLEPLRTLREPVYLTQHLLPMPALKASAFYRAWLEPRGLLHGVGAVVLRDEARIARVECYRSRGARAFGAEDLEPLRRLEPHLRRALQLNQKFWDALAQPTAALQVLERLEVGVILIDERERPAHCNRYAEAVLANEGALRLGEEGFTAATPEETTALRALIAQAVRTGRGIGLHAGGALTLGSADGHPYHVLVSPLRTERNDLGLGGSRICAALFVSQPDRNRALPLESLKELFGLTQSEAVIVQELNNGHTLDETAKRIHISRHTARDHLKAIFQKTGTRRQAELVKLVLSSPTSFVRETELLGTALGGELERRQVRDRRELARAQAVSA